MRLDGICSRPLHLCETAVPGGQQHNALLSVVQAFNAFLLQVNVGLPLVSIVQALDKDRERKTCCFTLTSSCQCSHLLNGWKFSASVQRSQQIGHFTQWTHAAGRIYRLDCHDCQSAGRNSLLPNPIQPHFQVSRCGSLIMDAGVVHLQQPRRTCTTSQLICR